MRSEADIGDRLTVLVANVLWGIRWGAIAGLLFSSLVFTLYLFSGTTPLDRQDVSLFEAVQIYLVCGLAGGVVVGLTRPFTDSQIGAAVVGVLAAIPLAFAIIGTLEGFSPWTTGRTLIVAVVSLVAGAACGIAYRNIQRSRAGRSLP